MNDNSLPNAYYVIHLGWGVKFTTRCR